MIAQYIALFDSPAKALASLNEALGTSYRVNRLYEWRCGSRPVPKPVENYIRLQITSPVLSSEGIEVPDNTAQRIARRLS